MGCAVERNTRCFNSLQKGLTEKKMPYSPFFGLIIDC